jgi:hypothetical protein
MLQQNAGEYGEADVLVVEEGLKQAAGLRRRSIFFRSAGLITEPLGPV